MALLEVTNLSVHYETQSGTAKAVENISFSLEKGETIGFIGESGCGKSTTASALIRMVQPPGFIAGGSIVFEGKDLLSYSEQDFKKIRGKDIAIVRQQAQHALNPVMRIGDQITEIIKNHEGVSNAEAVQRANEQLELVGLDSGRFRSYPHQFSGGMKQRTIIAIATACRPGLLILDEPITGLDVIVQRQLLTLLKDLKAELDLTTIFIAHDLAVVSETCSQTAVMYGGKIVEKTETAQLFKKPLHPYSEALVKSYPSILGEKQELYSIPGSPPDLINPPKGCRFAERCEKAMPVCREKEPAEYSVDGRTVLCHLYGDKND